MSQDTFYHALRTKRGGINWRLFWKDCLIIAKTYPRLVLVILIAELWGAILIAKHILVTMSVGEILRKILFLG